MDPANQEKFKEFYGREIDLDKGITKVTALDLCGNEIRAMLIDGENTLLSDPDRAHCEHALKSLDHLVVIDIFPTDTAELADVVLPATAFGETDGVCSNTERRVQRLRAAVPPPGQAQPDWWIICQLAQRLGLTGFDFEEPKAVFNELCSVSPIYAGLDWERIENSEYQWPVPHKDHPGTPRLHEEEFVNGARYFLNRALPRSSGDHQRRFPGLADNRTPAPILPHTHPNRSGTGHRLPAVRGSA